MPVAEIADRLGRDPSTIYRDIKRNRYTDTELPELEGYYALNAQDMYDKRCAIHRKMIVHPDLKAAIEDRLKAGWSTEQIAGCLDFDGQPIRACQETIYRYIYSNEAMDRELWCYLPEHLKARRPRRARKRLPPKFDRDVSLLFRPDDVAHRRQYSCLVQTTLWSVKCDLPRRTSEPLRSAAKNPNKRAKPVMCSIMKAVHELPHIARRSITFDRGTKFVGWPHLQTEIGTQAWFSDPSSLWRKGTVENTNRGAGR